MSRNLLTILSALERRVESTTLEKRFDGSGYGDLKTAVADAFVDVRRPRSASGSRAYLDDPAALDAVLARRCGQGPEVAGPTLADGLRPGRLPAGGAGDRERLAPSEPHASSASRSRSRSRTAPSCRAGASGSATRSAHRSRPTSRCCRRPRSTPCCCPRSTSTCADGRGQDRPVRDPAARHRAPSGRCRRSCSSPLAEGIADCELLETRVRGRRRCGDPCYFPYHPHVTVAHDLPDDELDAALDELADYAADFTVDRFVLYEHLDGVWMPYREFPFAGG